jgi:ferrous iron transport protein A
MQKEENTLYTLLSVLLPGEQATVRAYKGKDEIHYRLRELGLTRGTPVRVKRYAPLGDPMELIVRGYHLSLRRKDAESILVEKMAINL